MPKEHDTPSEVDSSDTLSQRIYTPTSSTTGGMNTGSGSTVSADEQDAENIPEHVPLLYDQPPKYADAACGDEDEKASLARVTDISAKEVEAGNRKDGPHPMDRCRAGGCRRARFRRVCLLVSVKMILLVGSLGWLVWFFGGFGGSGVNWSRYRPCHAHHRHPTTTFASKPTREIVVDQGSRSIWGKYPLFDQLSLSTTSGDIGVTVLPQPADPDHPDEPARLRIRSESGSVRVSFSVPEAARVPEYELSMEMARLDMEMAGHDPDDTDTPAQQRGTRRRNRKQQNRKCKCKGKSKCCNKHNTKPGKQPLPARPYIIDIETQSGSISGRFIFSHSISLSSSSGSITANLIPLVYSTSPPESDSQNVSVQTHTQTGSQQVCLTEPIFVGSSDGSGSGSVDRNSYYPPVGSSGSAYSHASHRSDTGSMHISYPKQWAGNVHAESGASILLSGRGLEVKEGDGVVDGRKDSEGEHESGKWWGGKMDVSLGSAEGAIMFFAA